AIDSTSKEDTFCLDEFLRLILMFVHVRIQKLRQMTLVGRRLVVEGKKAEDYFLFGEPVQLLWPHLVQTPPCGIFVRLLQELVKRAAVNAVPYFLVVQLHPAGIQPVEYREQIFHVRLLLEITTQNSDGDGQVFDTSIVLVQ